jgi:hypothetical protein
METDGDHTGGEPPDMESIEALLLAAFSYGLVDDGWFSEGALHVRIGKRWFDLEEREEGRAFLKKLLWGRELAVALNTRTG